MKLLIYLSISLRDMNLLYWNAIAPNQLGYNWVSVSGSLHQEYGDMNYIHEGDMVIWNVGEKYLTLIKVIHK